ncbi:MAG: NAD-dependent epimerase/dehydratase family protein [Candidatus Magasanikbacteria bacterium]|jgi:UDP-glucose 4-epimerase|nr:NAD-dependent epimerase/dehydratase family protein [Candidatus Magasanikbacteria bacterium]MBT4314817.1 NAD-dependent epimerase/dehydratase family protein [Candidatus Magasanikbacteria bacterium]MBT4547594.1 NAD-dependent epimerase/dehydratase family protein [Candidatus Magasanikbacteria bacterium]MBT6818843.1 NAD-dependent epimerase/dehydratase family protein [Candidatus Magasanikbacteria bacterium]
MKKKIKILLTGGSGFFGRNIVELLGDKYEILAPNSKELNLLDTSLVYNFLKKEKVDIVIHAAAVGVARNEKDNPGIVLDNLKMFFNLVRAKKMYKRMIFLGSGAEYNKQQELKNIRESDFDKSVPEDPYGFYKYVCAKYCEEASFITHLRLFGVYGKYEDYKTRFISNIICKVLLGLPVTMNQDTYFDYLYVNDFVKILGYFIENEKTKHKFYNIGRGERVSLSSIVHRILYVLDEEKDIKINKPDLNKEYTCDISRLKSELKNIEYTELDQSLLELIKYYKTILNKLNKKDFLYE